MTRKEVSMELSEKARKDIYRVRHTFRKAKTRIDLALKHGVKNAIEYEKFIKEIEIRRRNEMDRS